jgi:hypothetical protein
MVSVPAARIVGINFTGSVLRRAFTFSKNRVVFFPVDDYDGSSHGGA